MCGCTLGMSDEEIEALERVTIIACGTSYHAGMLARNLFARAAGLPVDVEVASEFLNLQLRPRALLLGITQSGETADTLLALKKAKTCGGRSLAITNVVGLNGDGAGGRHDLYSLRAGDRRGCDQDLHLSARGHHFAGHTSGSGPRPSDARSGQKDAH